MSGASYKLFDENLVRNIMINTTISVFEFMKEHQDADIKDVCEFIEISGDYLIDDTIENMDNMDNMDREGFSDSDESFIEDL